MLASLPGANGVASDGAAAWYYGTLRDECVRAGQPVPPAVDGDFATAQDLYSLCDVTYVDLGDGQDEFYGSSGPEGVFGGYGDDVVYGNGGCDVVIGDKGNDTIVCGGSSSPYCYNGEPVNTCTASGWGGDDLIRGGPGKDFLHGNGGADFIDGGEGADTIKGGAGDDVLLGGELDFNDVLIGGEGDDLLSGGRGYDTIDGEGDGPNGDTFFCRSAASTTGVPQDPTDADLDCAIASGTGIEHVLDPDPHQEWTPRYDRVIHPWEGGRVIDTTFDTTDSLPLMLDARLAGASLVMQEPGVIPVAGNFCTTGCPTPPRDGVAYFVPATGDWLIDHDLDGTVDLTVTGFGTPMSRPFAADLDGDGVSDLGYFDPITHQAFVDTNRDGDADDPGDILFDVPGVGPGDLPIAGLFHRPDPSLVFFRPRTRRWYEVVGTGPTLVEQGDLTWEVGPGAVPLGTDIFCDGVLDPAVYHRTVEVGPTAGAHDEWRYWLTLGAWTSGMRDWYGGHSREYPVTGDFDGDGCRDDLGLVDLVDGEMVALEDGFESALPAWDSSWTFAVPADAQVDGDPLHSSHVQGAWNCGPQSLEMVLRQLGLTQPAPPGMQLCFDRDISLPQAPQFVASATWDVTGATADLVSVGYLYSAEHIIYDALWEMLDLDPAAVLPYSGACHGAYYITAGTTLDNSGWAFAGDFLRVDYGLGEIDPIARPDGLMQTWAMCVPGMGMEVGDEALGRTGVGLAGVANRAALNMGRSPDALVIGSPAVDHYRAIVRGFVDHGIPLLIGVDRGGHFNAIVGYWDAGSSFYVYTSDPLDGALRRWEHKPMRWQRFVLTQDLLDSGVLGGMMAFGHDADGGCTPMTGWAWEIDSSFSGVDLCP